jgi:hypothetical protein
MSLTNPPPTAQKVGQVQAAWRKRVELVRSRLLFRSLDAAVTACLRPKASFTTHLRQLFSLRYSNNYNRVATAINLVDDVIPGTARAVSTMLTRSMRLPFALNRVELMSYGSGATVFLLRGHSHDQVLKVYRESLGRDREGVMAVIDYYRSKYETVRAWYNGRVQLVPPAQFLILHGPILKRPAAAILQPYIDGDKHDLFEDFNDEALLELVRQDTFLAEQFVFFVRRTLSVYTDQGLCLDFVGRDNLMLVRNDNGWRLLIIDNGIFEPAVLRQKTPATVAQLESRLERLRHLCQQLTPVGVAPPRL